MDRAWASVAAGCSRSSDKEATWAGAVPGSAVPHASPSSWRSGHQSFSKTQPPCLLQPLSHATGASELASETDLTDGDTVRPERQSRKGRGKGETDSEVGCRLASTGAAGYGNVHVALAHRHARSPVEDGDEEAHAARVEARDETTGQCRRTPHQGLDLDEHGTMTLDRHCHRRPGCALEAVAKEQAARVGDTGQATLGHLEQPGLTSRPKPVLYRP